jgi:ferrous iron transport protein B
VRSIFDRTLFVLGRSLIVAAPAGLIIYIISNAKIYDITLLSYCADFLDPFAQLLGLDGVILIAFILGFPANEIVIPIVIMAYMENGVLEDGFSLLFMKNLFIDNGWTIKTAISMLIFTLCHWPCSTTVLTVKKETASVKWTMLSILLPTAFGVVLCMMFNLVYGFVFKL